jgi:protoporphyrinogen oxidase
MPSVIVLGGGIAGLAVAHRLAERGASVTVIEACDRLGGLGGTFEHDGRRHERFYHSVTSTDDALLRLISDAGLGEQCTWRRTTMGMVVAGEHYDFNTPWDLLRFAPLSLAQRIRLGAAGKTLRLLGRGKDLDRISAEAWLRPIFGDAVWRQVWRPMFAMKFGGEPVPALYLYERLARESNVADRAYPKIGYQGLADGVAASIERMGGTVRTGTRVRSLRIDEGEVVAATDAGDITAPWAVATLPIPLLKEMSAGSRASEVAALPALSYMGVVNVLFLLKRPLSGHYWSAVIESGTGFDGQIEMSALTGPEHFGGHHAVYVMRYTDRSSDLYAEPDDSIRSRWTEQFIALNDLARDDITATFVFRTPFVEPVWPLGYLDAKPPPQVGTSRLFLATTAQAYPRVTSWNAAVQTAEDTVTAMGGVL